MWREPVGWMPEKIRFTNASRGAGRPLDRETAVVVEEKVTAPAGQARGRPGRGRERKDFPPEGGGKRLTFSPHISTFVAQAVRLEALKGG